MIYDLPRIMQAITAGEILQTMDALSKADMRTHYGGHFAADFETVVMFCAGKHIGAQEERARAASLGRVLDAIDQLPPDELQAVREHLEGRRDA